MAGPTLIVMAAGIGRRFGGLKQLEPVGPHGETVPEYAVFDALRAGFGKVVFVVRPELAAEFRERIGGHVEPHAETAYVRQTPDDLPGGVAVAAGRTKPWGTAHAVWCCRRAVVENFAVINADDYYGPMSFKVLNDYLRRRDGAAGYDYCMVGFRLRNVLSPHGAVKRGICSLSPDGFLTRVTEYTAVRAEEGEIRYESEDGDRGTLDPEAMVSMNCWGFTPSLFGELERRLAAFMRRHGADPQSECFLPTVVNDLINEGKARVRVLPTRDPWFGVTYREDLDAFRRAISERVRSGLYPAPLWS